MKNWIKRFSSEEGAIFEYIFILAFVAVIAAMYMPDLRKTTGCIHNSAVSHIQVGISSSGGTSTGDCEEFYIGDLIAGGGPIAPPPPVTHNPPNNETIEFPTERDGTCYVVRTLGQLQAMNQNLTACYVLGNSIDASPTSGWNGGKGFEPIGRQSSMFEGSFDGKGYEISNLYINRTDYYNDKHIGLFGFAAPMGTNSSPTKSIQNVRLINVNIKGQDSVGGLAGYAYIDVKNVYVTGRVESNRGPAGGIVGDLEYKSMVRSHANVKVIGGHTVGGIIGETYYSSIQNSYALGEVHGTNSWNGNAGGLIGSDWGSTIKNCFSAAKLFGAVSNKGIVDKVDGTTVTASFYDKDVTGATDTGKGTPITTVQMKTQSTYTGWDFASIWGIEPSINNGYPYLRGNPSN